MPLVLPEHQSITIQDHAHGQGKEDGSQVWALYQLLSNDLEYSCRTKISLKLFWKKYAGLVLVTC